VRAATVVPFGALQTFMNAACAIRAGDARRTWSKCRLLSAILPFLTVPEPGARAELSKSCQSRGGAELSRMTSPPQSSSFVHHSVRDDCTYNAIVLASTNLGNDRKHLTPAGAAFTIERLATSVVAPPLSGLAQSVYHAKRMANGNGGGGVDIILHA
jgi:hypothetical protein